MSVFEQILALLEEHNVPYRLTEHEPVRTSEQAATCIVMIEQKTLKGEDDVI